jgi:hypothetical protein
MMKADPTWLPEFRARYATWRPHARPLIGDVARQAAPRELVQLG